jgi:hypothetical protein
MTPAEKISLSYSIVRNGVIIVAMGLVISGVYQIAGLGWATISAGIALLTLAAIGGIVHALRSTWLSRGG